MYYFHFSYIEYNSSPLSQLTGKKPQHYALPEAAHVVYLFLTKNHTYLCGGALIQRQHILVPASCVPNDIILFHYFIMFGWPEIHRQYGRPVRRDALRDDNINIAVLMVTFFYTNFKFETLMKMIVRFSIK